MVISHVISGLQVLFQVALMILKFIEQPLLECKDEAEAIAVLNAFLANIGKKQAQENKVQDEDPKVTVCLSAGLCEVRV